MRTYINTSLFTICISLMISCKQKNNEAKDAVSSNAIQPGTGLAVCCDGSITFRRTFADLQFIDDEKEQDRYMAEQEKSNPGYMPMYDKDLLSRFEALGFVKGEELLQDKFDRVTLQKSPHTDDGNNFEYVFNAATKIKFRFKYAPDVRGFNRSSVIERDHVTIYTLGYDEIKFAVLDVIPGGNKELVVLQEYHIMNGDNFEFSVYQISGL